MMRTSETNAEGLSLMRTDYEPARLGMSRKILDSGNVLYKAANLFKWAPYVVSQQWGRVAWIIAPGDIPCKTHNV